MKEALRFVKNIKTGVVFPLTRVLEKMRKDLIPCTRSGLAIMRDHVDMPSLCNPYTGVIVPNNEENARIIGLIPCRDAEHAEEIKLALMGMGGNTVEQSNGLQEPPVKTAEIEPPLAPPATIVDIPEDQVVHIDSGSSDLTFDQSPDVEFISMLRSTKVDEMDKDACKSFALEHFGEKLSKTNGEETLREKVQVMINSKLAEAA